MFSRRFGAQRWMRWLWRYMVALMVLTWLFSIQTTTKEDVACDQDLEMRLQGPLNADDPNLIRYIRERYILPPSAQPYNLSTDPFYIQQARGYSWPFVHDILLKLFQEERSKFFVEAGGFDGEFLSNTLWLEANYSWTGLLVEPHKDRFEEMVYKRRNCWIANACLSVDSYPRSIVLTSMEVQTNTSKLDPNIIRASSHSADGAEDIYQWIKRDIRKTNFTSQCFPLQSFLLALNQTTVDFLSLDLEGSEINVFASLPLHTINVRTVVMENYSQEFDLALIKWMNRRGFKILDVGGAPDYFFINAKETELIKKYRRHHRYLQHIIDDKKNVIKLYQTFSNSNVQDSVIR